MSGAMSNHLTEDQIANWFVGRSTSGELQHVAECAECSAELERCKGTISVFRRSVRTRIDARIAQQPVRIQPNPVRPAGAAGPWWRWALATATLVIFAVVPFLTRERLMP